MTDDQRAVRTLESPPSKRSHWTYDIETYTDSEGRHQFLYGAVYDGDQYYEFEQRESMANFLLSTRKDLRSAWLWAHNAEFDLSVLGVLDTLREYEMAEKGGSTPDEREIENMATRDAKVIMDGGFKFARYKVLSERYKDDEGEIKEKWRSRLFLDSSQFFLASLEAAAEMMGVESKGGFDVGQLAPKSKMSKQRWDEMRDYCKRDCRVLYQAICEYEDNVNDLGATLQPTLASTSLDLFRRRYQREKYVMPEGKPFQLAEESRYGGLTLALVNEDWNGTYKASEAGLWKIDINSSYPYQMTKGIPSGNSMYEPFEASIDNIHEHEGVSRCVVTVPDDETIPVLPIKEEVEGSEKLLFPTGRLVRDSGLGYCWTHAELRYALSRGYEIEEVQEQVVAPDRIDELGEFAEDMYSHRKDQESDGNMGAAFTTKIVLNSQYGKWCQNDITQREYVPKTKAHEFDAEELQSEHIMVDGDVISVPTVEGETIKINNNHPIVGGYITALGRLQLLEAMHDVEELGGTPLYADTDSIVISGLDRDDVESVVDLGDHLGEWDVEAGPGVIHDVGGREQAMQDYQIRVVREKAYQERLIYEDRCKIKTTLKGVPKEYRMAAIEGETVEMERWAGYKEALHRNDVEPQQIHTQEKQIRRKGSSKRVFEGDGYSRAVNLQELRESRAREESRETAARRSQERLNTAFGSITAGDEPHENTEAEYDDTLSARENKQVQLDQWKEQARDWGMFEN